MINLTEHNKAELRSICQTHFVVKLFLFGSAVRDDFQAKSDLDFAVIFTENLTPLEQWDAYFGLKDALEALYIRQIDLISYPVIKNPIFKKELDKTKVELYAA
ncbi:MAG: nucleotidyltransferase family protein [Bacteroidia bacterium]